MKIDRKRDLARYRPKVLQLHSEHLFEDVIAERLGITVHQVRLILIAWGPDA